MVGCSAAEHGQVPAAAGHGAAVHEAEGGCCGGSVGRGGRRGQRQARRRCTVRVSRLRQELHVEARTEHAQAAALREGAALPVSALSQAVLPAGQPGQSYQERAHAAHTQDAEVRAG